MQVGRESNFPRQILKCAPEPRVSPRPASAPNSHLPFPQDHPFETPAALTAHGTRRRPSPRIRSVFASALPLLFKCLITRALNQAAGSAGSKKYLSNLPRAQGVGRFLKRQLLKAGSLIYFSLKMKRRKI